MQLTWLQQWLYKWRLPILNPPALDLPIVDKTLLLHLRHTLNTYLGIHKDCVIPLIPEWGACARMCMSGMAASVRKQSSRRLVMITPWKETNYVCAFDLETRGWSFLACLDSPEYLHCVLDCRFFAGPSITVQYQLVDFLVYKSSRATQRCLDRIVMCETFIKTSGLLNKKIMQAIVSTRFNVLPNDLILDKDDFTTITLLDYDWFSP